MKRYALTLKILLGFFALCAVTVIIMGWRLASGPIELDWAGDYLKKALVANQEGADIEFRDAVLIWQKADNRNFATTSGLQILFYELEVKDRTSGFTLKLPEAGVRFSGLAMLRGLLAPTDIEFSNLAIEYTLDEKAWISTDNRPFMEKLESVLEHFRSSPGLLADVVRKLLSSPKSSEFAGYLRQVSFKNTTITVKDQLSGQHWKMPNAQLNVRRTDLGLLMNLTGDIGVADTNLMPLDLSVIFNNAKQEAVALLNFSELRASALAGKVEALAGLSEIDIPAKGNIELTIDRDFVIPHIAFTLALGEGTFNAQQIYQQPLQVSSAALNGYIQKSENAIILDEISVKLGQTDIKGSGLLYGTLEKPGISIKADITSLPFSDLKSYWPGQFGAGAYNWIYENIEAGIVPTGELNISIKPEMWTGDGNGLPADSFTFDFEVDKIKAHYLRPMPVLSNISGNAQLNLRSFALTTTGGKIADLSIKKADLLFTDLDVKNKGAADINIELDGTVEEILRVIDFQPLGFPSKYGIEQGTITGQAKANVSLKFPLLKSIKLVDVIYDVKADIENLAIPELTESLAIRQGKLSLHVDDNGIKAEGSIHLNDVDFEAIWTENFKNTDGFPTEYSIKGNIEGGEWEKLNLPFDPFVEGPVDIDLILYGHGGKLAKGNGQFGLLNSRAIFTPLGWVKEKGKAGLVDFDILFPKPSEINIRNIHLQSDNLQASLEVDLEEDQVTRFFIPKLKMNDTDMTMLLTWDRQQQKYLASLKGNSFWASPLIDIITAPSGNEEKINLPDFDLEADLKALVTKNNVALGKTKVTARYRDRDFTHVDFSALFADDKKVTIEVTPENENRRLQFNSDNAGEALRGLGLFNLGVGGDMQLSAEMVTHESGISLGGVAEVKDFKVIKSPGFSKLLEEKKFEKAQEELDKGGLNFSTFEMEFRQFNGILEINKAHARGPMLGMTIEGFVDQSYDEMGLSGTLIPAYGINSLISNIPLIGTILTGGKGQGIFAATYTIKGGLDNPDININPLAALAPGILRTIFSAMGNEKKKTLREEAEELEKIIPNTKPDQSSNNKRK